MTEELKAQILELIKSELTISISIRDAQGYGCYNDKEVCVSLMLGDEEIASEYDTFSVED